MDREQSSWEESNSLSFDITRTSSQIHGSIGRVVQGMIPDFQTERLTSSIEAYNSHNPPPTHGQYSISDISQRNDSQMSNIASSIIDMSDSPSQVPVSNSNPTDSPVEVNSGPGSLLSGLASNASQTSDSRNNGLDGINFQTLRNWMEGYFPFVLIALSKLMYDHRLGILIFICLFGTFYHANSCLKNYITQKESSRTINLLFILGFLLVNIFFIFYVFNEDKLYRVLYLQLPQVERIDLWGLLWIVGMMDFIVKFVTICLKTLIALAPNYVLSHKRKGKYYMLIEYISQSYRSILPIIPWISFILNNEYGGEGFSYFLLGFYFLCKVHHLYNKCKELKYALGKFKLDISYGFSPSHQDLENFDKSCPICQDKLKDPVKLACKHIFCEDCVSMWFDREKTCPMCRAKIIDNPLWRDGTTSALTQLY